MNRFDQIIGNIAANRFFHDVLLLAFGDHHNRHVRTLLFDPRQGVKTRNSGHIFIQKDDIKLLFIALIDRRRPIIHRNDRISF